MSFNPITMSSVNKVCIFRLCIRYGATDGFALLDDRSLAQPVTDHAARWVYGCTNRFALTTDSTALSIDSAALPVVSDALSTDLSAAVQD